MLEHPIRLHKHKTICMCHFLHAYFTLYRLVQYILCCQILFFFTWSHTDESRSICWCHVFPWKECCMKCGVWNQMKIWFSHLLDNLSNCRMNLKNSGDSTGFEPMTSAMPVQCSNQLSYEVTQMRAGQFVGLMFSCERNVVWKECYMKCGVSNKMKIWSSHLLENLSNFLMSPTNWPALIYVTS